MRRIFVPFIICAILILCCISCKDSNGKTVDYDSEWFDNTTPEFDTKRQSIIYREHMRYDIKGNIAVPYTITNSISYNFCCEFSFFNYGEDIRLFNGCNEDFFITGIGTIRYARVLKREDNIEIASKRHNEKYGDWALVNLTIGKELVADVFMTPLAMKAYKDGDDDSYIFIQFVAKDKYMNVLFYGGPRECLVVMDRPDVILTKNDVSYNIDGPISGPGQFWHKN